MKFRINVRNLENISLALRQIRNMRPAALKRKDTKKKKLIILKNAL